MPKGYFNRRKTMVQHQVVDFPLFTKNVFGELAHWENVFMPQRKSFPPYNIIVNEEGNQYTLELAVAGFTKDDLAVTFNNGILSVEGEQASALETDPTEYYKEQLISRKAFKRSFPVSPGYEVQEVNLAHGLLTVILYKTKEDRNLLTIQEY
jgi:HSP20 family molecular chaperone IbpA